MPDFEPPQKNESTLSIRSVDEAAQIVTASMKMLPGEGQSRSGGRTFNLQDVKIGHSKNSSKAETDTLIYVFNFDNNEGFAVVAAPRSHQGLIAITEAGSYDPEIEPDVPGLAIYMDAVLTGIKDNISLIDDSLRLPLEPGPSPNPDLIECMIRNDTVETATLDPNYDMRWGQLYPEGIYAPNGKCGCSNLSMLMAMSYYEYPNSIKLTYKEIPYDLQIDWSKIKGHKQSFYSSYELQNDGCESSTHEDIANICRELGFRNESVYGPTGTGTYDSKVISTFDNLGYSCFKTTIYTNFLKRLLDQEHVMIMTGKRSYSDANGEEHDAGHMWIADGYIYYKVHSYECTRAYRQPWICEDRGETESIYLHVNWGWNGAANGYYHISSYDPRYAYKFDQPYNNSGYGYSSITYFAILRK